jgi:hypothetical protein
VFLVTIEQKFSIKQATKLFPQLGLKVINGYLTNLNNKRQEETHVVSYYILKALNMVHLEMYLAYLRQNDYKSGVLASYVKHLVTILHKRLVNMDVTDNDKLFSELPLKSKRILKNNYNNNRSLRMSCVDVSII